MGKIIKAECDCGFHLQDIYFGAGMFDSDSTFSAPAICLKCKQMHNNNYYFKNTSVDCNNYNFKKALVDYIGFFEIFLRYLIPGLVQYDKSENFLKFVFFLSLAFLGWCWIFMLRFGDSFYVGLLILLLVYIPSILKTTQHYFNSQKSETNRIGDNLCPNCKNEVVFYNDQNLMQFSQVEQNKSEDELIMDYTELYSDDFWLPKTKYFCPKCNKMKMEFKMDAFFD